MQSESKLPCRLALQSGWVADAGCEGCPRIHCCCLAGVLGANVLESLPWGAA